MRYAALLLAAVTVTACEVNLNSEGIVSRDTRKFEVTANPEIEIDTFDGAIEVHSWDRNEVEVEIEKRAMEQRLVDEMQVTAEQQGNKIVVKVSAPSRSEEFSGVQIGVHFSPSARLRLVVPRQSQLTARSGDGSITVEDVAGRIHLNTSDGSVRGTRLDGEITVRSGDGSIRFDRAQGKLDLETDDGAITLAGSPSALRLRTMDGTIRLELQPDTVVAEDWDLQTGDGSVVLTLPSELNAVIDAETRDGVVRANHPSVRDEQRDGETREERRQTLRAAVGTGGHVVRIRTGDGSIRIE